MSRPAIFTAVELAERQKERCRRWHQKMTAERRCHWCGKPSHPDYANACFEHLEATRESASASKKRVTLRRRSKGLCTYCGQRETRFGYDTCALCGAKQSALHRTLREAISVKNFDEIIDLDLVLTREASKIIGVTNSEIHRLVKLGRLRPHKRSRKKFWFRADYVEAYRRERTERMLNLVGCLKCKHEWWLRANNGSRLRCPVRGCRSFKVTQYKSNDIKPKCVLSIRRK